VLGERRWERALRETDFGEDATNFCISLCVAEAEAEGSPTVVVRVERKRWACLVSTHLRGEEVSFFGSWWRLYCNGRGSLRLPPNPTTIIWLSR
jgi:hypothetical protein